MKERYLVLAMTIACASIAFAGTSQQEQNKAVVRRLFDAIRHGDLATFNAISDPECIVHTASGGSHKSGSPFKDLKSACPLCVSVNPREITIDFLVAEDDLVTVRSTLSGTQVGQLVGVPPTGKQFVVSYINIYRIRNGRIVENWVGLDRLGLAQQLGMQLCPKEAK
jgi:ketosteroid isomerase-like protein